MRLHFHFSLSCIGGGNGTPLQCSCLENPRDGRAWWAAFCGVAQSCTWLKWQQQQVGMNVNSYLSYILSSWNWVLTSLFTRNFTVKLSVLNLENFFVIFTKISSLIQSLCFLYMFFNGKLHGSTIVLYIKLVSVIKNCTCSNMLVVENGDIL